jgi:uncharacterized membrane protein
MQRTSRETAATESPAGETSLHFAGFFITVFVFGQIMSQWALWSAHYAAWITGLLFSLAGISIAVGSLVATVRSGQSGASIPRLAENQRNSNHGNRSPYSRSEAGRVSA